MKPVSKLVRYYISGLELSVYPAAYLVEVRNAGKESPSRDQLSDLPEWVLRSHETIWLADEPAPIYNRAIKGDSIKKQLLAGAVQ
jgi:hypothetical protein